MRIVAGKHKNRNIATPEGRDVVRPTAARTREAIFNIIMHGDYGLVGGAVADIFCGSGAMGLEALSRGAKSVTFVDKSREAIEAVEYNIEKFGEEAASRVLRADSSQLPPSHTAHDVIFIDPPYRSGLHFGALATIHSGGWLKPDGIIVLEESRKEPVKVPESFRIVDERHYGNAGVWLLQLA